MFAQGAPRRHRLSTSFAISAVVTAVVVLPGGFADADTPPDWDGDGAVSADCRPLDPAVHPAATDHPDLAFEDLNCDGIDGDKANAYFVMPAGSDANVGTSNAPFQTIQRAIDAARTTSKKSIYVATGSYSQRLTLGSDADGIRIHGGYEAVTWARTTATSTTVSGQPEAMVLDGARDVVIQLVRLEGTRGFGISAYGVRANNNSEVALIRTRATAGAGGAGAIGWGGSTPSKAASGAPGQSGPADCNIAGAGGSSSQPGNGTDGGAGGAGGEETNDGENGAPGTKGEGFFGGAAGAGGVDIAGDSHGANDGMHGQTGGTGGTGFAGSNGGGGANDLGNAGATWAGRDGTDGTDGGDGYGGGGGGGGAGRGGAFDWGAGAGGGQGGDGGAGGLRGFGGQWGGGSFGLYLHNSEAAVVDGSALQAGNGGAGGAGGTGGNGGAGGDGGAGGVARTTCGLTLGNGGAGGPGGPGGSGGNGGGGSGGPSVALIRLGTAGSTVAASTLEFGAGGAAGARGGAQAGQAGTSIPAGASVTDFDGDGITDAGDACVEIPRGTDGNGDGCPDRAAALADGDGDGVPNDGRDACPSQASTGADADQDGCTDAASTPTNTTTTPTTTDGTTTTPATPGTVDETPTGDALDRISSLRLGTRFRATRRWTTFSRLRARGVPAGSTVRATCKPKRRSQRKMCPRAFSKRNASGVVAITGFTKRRLPVGAVITITVTKPGAIGAAKVLLIRSGRAPAVSSLCVPVGSTKPARSCAG